jgi:hypothetical protein
MQVTGPMSDSLNKKYIPSPNMYYPKPKSNAYNITLKSKINDKSI